MTKIIVPPEGRFFNKVKITKSCWLWIAAKDAKGYGFFRFRGKMIRAHRFSYELFIGPIKRGKMILHKRECSNPSCVNPLHLYMGDALDNMMDSLAQGRQGMPGEKHPGAKMSEEDVLAIRDAYENKNYITQSAMAEEFGVSTTCISRIVRRVSWKHLR